MKKFQIYMILESTDSDDGDDYWIDTEEHAAVDIEPFVTDNTLANLEVAAKILDAASLLIEQATKIAAEDADDDEKS